MIYWLHVTHANPEDCISYWVDTLPLARAAAEHDIRHGATCVRISDDIGRPVEAVTMRRIGGRVRIAREVSR